MTRQEETPRVPTTRSQDDRSFRIALWLFSLVLLVFAVVPVLHSLRGHSVKDYELWEQTGQLVLQGREIYPDRFHKFDFMYAPSCALLLAPVSLLGQTGLVIVLVVVNATAWVASIVFSVRLSTGTGRRASVLIYAVPNAIVLIYVWGNFLLGQPSLVLLALLLGAFLALQGRWNVLGGSLIACAAAIKAFPVIAILYLLYRRYWIAAASLTITLALLLVILPTCIRGSAQAGTDLRRWVGGMLLKYDEKGLGQRAGKSNVWKNQSIFGVANRMLRHVDYDDQYAPHAPVYANVADVSFSTVNRIIGGAALTTGLIFIAVMPRRNRRTRESDALEFALLLLLMLIFTPLTFGYLFAWLLYPFTVITRRLMVLRSASLLVCAASAVFLLGLTIPWRVAAQTYGNVFFAALILIAGLALELLRLKLERQPEPATL